MSQILTEGRIDLGVTPTLDDESEDFTGWYCIKTDLWRCRNCGNEVEFMTAAHFIIVWPDKDDPDLLFHAQRCGELERNPRVIEYEYGFGKSISYFDLQANGYPTCESLARGFA